MTNRRRGDDGMMCGDDRQKRIKSYNIDERFVNEDTADVKRTCTCMRSE